MCVCVTWFIYDLMRADLRTFFDMGMERRLWGKKLSILYSSLSCVHFYS